MQTYRKAPSPKVSSFIKYFRVECVLSTDAWNNHHLCPRVYDVNRTQHFMDGVVRNLIKSDFDKLTFLKNPAGESYILLGDLPKDIQARQLSYYEFSNLLDKPGVRAYLASIGVRQCPHCNKLVHSNAMESHLKTKICVKYQERQSMKQNLQPWKNYFSQVIEEWVAFYANRVYSKYLEALSFDEIVELKRCKFKLNTRIIDELRVVKKSLHGKEYIFITPAVYSFIQRLMATVNRTYVHDMLALRQSDQSWVFNFLEATDEEREQIQLMWDLSQED